MTTAAIAPPLMTAPTTRRGRVVWGTTWRVAVAALVGLLAFGAILPEDPELAGGLVALDFVLGIVAICLLPLRRSAPVPMAVAIGALSGFSVLAVGAAVIAIISVATRRRWPEIAVVAGASAASAALYELVNPAAVEYPWWALALTGLGLYGALVLIGLYLGGRRELLTTLRDRAETAEREQVTRIEQARATERTRIAREMHDVLAHRISLVALHAGGLAFRDDLTRAETAGAAEIIRDNAHLALTELRDVLGVLREDDAESGPPRPQPTLADLPALVAESVAAGTSVRYDVDPQVSAEIAGLGVRTSRNAYRVVQEALTNARKHAPGQEVLIDVAGHPGAELTLVITNPLPPTEPRTGGTARPPGAGLGLIGLSERVRLAGGTLAHGVGADSRFVVRASLPWPT
ncbi:sensor histidine kinase [Pengzhenrongella sicca]|uniref:histidine kinase n=1 Tax=Pengzhenrongella sicca TaxID=2819238 RepID=A0A8A4ZA12_9MICO|nr:histidine kinase [Pengzhenrongella sicca]QTE28780.1 two-component sensor histidine kinase [Pengzhenrongella sicca]